MAASSGFIAFLLASFTTDSHLIIGIVLFIYLFVYFLSVL